MAPSYSYGSSLLHLLFCGCLLSVVAASRRGPGNFFEDYVGPGPNPPAPESAFALHEDYVGPGVHPPTPDSIFQLHEDYVGPGVHPPTPDSIFALNEDYVGPGVHPPTPDSIFQLHEDHVGPGVHPPIPDSIFKLDEDYVGPGGHPPAPDTITFVQTYASNAEPVNTRTSADSNLDHVSGGSVVFQASRSPHGIPIPQVRVHCSCSNGTQIPLFYIDPVSAYQIGGARDTTWICQFTWRTANVFKHQEFVVYAPPAESNEWTVDTEGFNLFVPSARAYLHVHDWVTGFPAK